MTRALACVIVLLLAVPALAADPIAALTELRGRRGEVEVKAADRPEWAVAKPLQSLRPGDQLRVSGEGRAVLLFTGGRGTVVVTSANSPFTVVAPATEGLGGRAKSVIGDVTGFLLRQERERTYQSLGTRGIIRAAPPAIVAPRNTRVMPEGLVFEWLGSDRLRYRVRLVGPQGVVWEAADLERKPLAYPASAPALTPGAGYVWELITREHGVQAAQFQVASASDAAAVRDALAELTSGAGSAYPPATLTLMRATVLFQDRFYADARRELAAAIAAAPQEATLHLMLGRVYERIGLRDLATSAFDEADALSGR
jgi:hypothetical protein